MSWLFNPANPHAHANGDHSRSLDPSFFGPRDHYDNSQGLSNKPHAQMPPWFKISVPAGTFKDTAELPFNRPGNQEYYLQRFDNHLFQLDPLGPTFQANRMTINSTAGTSCDVSAPGGILDGDLLLFALTRSDVSAALTWPTDFVELFDDSFGVDAALSVAVKVASGESGSYVVSWSGATRNVGCLYVIRGAVGYVQGANPTGSGTSPDPPSVDPDVEGDYLAVSLYGQNGAGATRFTPPSGYTEPASNSDGGTTGAEPDAEHCGLGLSYKGYNGQVENPVAATSSINAAWSAFTLIVRADPLAVSGGKPLFGRNYQSPRERFTGVAWGDGFLAQLNWLLQYVPSYAGMPVPSFNKMALIAFADTPFGVASLTNRANVMYIPQDSASTADYDTLARNKFELLYDIDANVALSNLITVEPHWP